MQVCCMHRSSTTLRRPSPLSCMWTTSYAWAHGRSWRSGGVVCRAEEGVRPEQHDARKGGGRGRGVQEVKYLNRLLRRTEDGIRWGLSPKHVEHFRSGYGIEQCGTAPPTPKGGSDTVRGGRELDPERAHIARRRIAILNYLAQGRPDLSVPTPRKDVQASACSHPVQGEW